MQKERKKDWFNRLVASIRQAMDKVKKYFTENKKATKSVGQIGLFDPKKGLPIELQQSGYIGSVTYKNQNVNIQENLFQWKIQKDKQKRQSYDCLFMEAPPRLELGIKVLQTSALPLGYGAIKLIENTSVLSIMWSGLRDSNSLPSPWQGDALPDELNPHIGASGRNRTIDTRIFSPLLYRLSYRSK